MAKEKKNTPAQVDAAAEALPPKKKKPRSNKRKKPTDDESNLPPEEQARRQRQRQLREIALKLRAQGKEYNHNKYRRRAIAEAATGGLRDDHKPRRAVDVIVVPIFWNRREDEKSMVLGAAARAQAALRSAGVKADTDTTHKLTPGQKFRHWEERGVMVRVEVGPHEAENGVCLFAVCKKAGEVAEKKRVKIGPELVDLAGSALGVELDSSNVENAMKSVPVGIQGVAAAPVSKKTVFEDDDAEEEEKVKNKVAGPSGDDLDGDFDESMLLGGSGDEQGGKKKKKKKRSGGDDDGEEGGFVKEKKKEKQKVVVF